MSTGGSVQEVAIVGRNFAVAADADSNRKLGGWENAVGMNGNGTGRKIMTRVAWVVGGLTLDVDHDRGDPEFLQGICDGTADGRGGDGFYTIDITYADGNTYQGRGTIVESLEASSMNATAAVTFNGPGKLEKQ